MAQGDCEPTAAAKASVMQQGRAMDVELVAKFIAVHAPRSRCDKAYGQFAGSCAGDSLDEFARDDLRCDTWLRLVLHHRLHNLPRATGRVKEQVRNSKYVTEVAEESDIIFDLLLRWVYPHLGQLGPHWAAAKGRDGVNGVQSVDWKTVSFLIVVFWLSVCQSKDALTHLSMEQAHSYSICVAFTTGLNRLQFTCHLEHPTKRFFQPPRQLLRGKASGKRQDLHHSRRCGVLPYEAL